MSSNAQLAYNALWIAHPILQAVVAGIMVWRKLHRTFPILFTYVVFQIVTFALTFPFHEDRYYAIFFYCYWATTAVSVVLGFKVIHEVFLDVFRPYHTLRDLGSVLFKWAGLVMLMVAGVMAASGPTGGDFPLVTAILTLQRSIRVVQCGLVLFLLVFSRYLGTSWRQKSFGIALGFGAFAGVELSLVAMGSALNNQRMSSFVNMAAYNLTILIWLGYALVKSPAREQEASTMLRSQRWEQSLNDIQHPVPADSLIPMFESMVDRALSRSSPEPAASASQELKVGESLTRHSNFSYPPLPRRVVSKT
jgi:hypothetical protein